MSQESLGLIETIGLAAAVAAADAAVKSANVTLVGYELAKGEGMTVVKLRGDVGAVEAAIAAAEVEAGRVGRVVATRVIARPARDLTKIVDSHDTVGAKPLGADARPAESVPAGEPPIAAKATDAATPSGAASQSEETAPAASIPETGEPAESATAPASVGEPEPPKPPSPRASARPDKNHRKR